MGKFGQLRSSQIESYGENLISAFEQKQEKIKLNGATFQNPCLYFSNQGIDNDSYYLKFEVVKRIDSSQTFTLKLLKSSLEQDDEQYIFDCFVPAASTNQRETVIFQIVFQPNSEYDSLVFEIKREPLDYYLSNLDGTSGRIAIINVLEFLKLINIVDYLKQNFDNDLNSLYKIGVQGPFGLLMCINGEQIRIGKNKIYEIDNNYKINFMSFAPTDEYFIMDFEY